MDTKYFLDENADLADILTASSVRSQFEKTPRYFVPQGEFDRIVTRETIRDTLYSRTEAEDAVLVDYIVKDARKLFAIAVLSDLSGPSYLTQAMYLFRDHNFSDSNLPIEDPPISEDGQFDLPAHPLRRLSKFWRGAMIHTFCYEQWKLLVPVFLPDGVYHDLGVQIIQFIDKSDEAREGSSGSVRRYTVHQDHIQGFATGGKAPSNIVAVKEIKRQHGHNWAAQATALAQLDTLNHDHIVRFITAFQCRLDGYEEQYLMFEWADGSNLRDLWVSIPEPKLEPRLIKAALIQLKGLAEALNAAHYVKDGLSYRHGNLKPENIWWFSDGTTLGKLKIGGWSEAKSPHVARKLWPKHGAAMYGARLYEPPEVMTDIDPTFLRQATQRHSRLCDICSMGCITLEFVVWLLYGVQGLNEFNCSIQGNSGVHSAFYRIPDRKNRHVAEVHDRVIHWMNFMSKDSACRNRNGTKTALGDVLAIVRDKLLVVEPPEPKHDRRSLAISRPQEFDAAQNVGVPTITVTLAQSN
ncbi:hypothetical protein SLS59_006497 [Nothophoma quercina]|uniref:Protein kinase domain-containing protein n=1 Tax=Nothophoma quercina TaxID=749835 RepID=A0ABR3R3V0_9PLEO